MKLHMQDVLAMQFRHAIGADHWCVQESFLKAKLLPKPESSPLFIYEGAGNQNQKQSDPMQSYEQVDKRPVQ